jgi:RNA polymerase-binding transcription factor DksA
MDLADNAQAIEERERAAALERQSNQPQEAAAIDDHGNRLCTDCLECIDIDRRLAAPHAVRCVECQLRHERLLKVHGASRPVCGG